MTTYRVVIVAVKTSVHEYSVECLTNRAARVQAMAKYRNSTSDAVEDTEHVSIRSVRVVQAV